MNDIRRIAVIGIRVNAATGMSNFRRNRDFAESFIYFYRSLITQFKEAEACLEIKQENNLIIIFWDLEQADSDLLAGYRSLLTIRRKANNSMSKSRIKICLAAEYAEAEVISLPLSEGKAAPYMINSDAEERVLKVLPSAGTGKYSAVILTHSFRSLLPQGMRQLFCCPCYFFHICCYCVKHM